MKNLKKILALLVAVLMIAVSMGTIASAADYDTSINITGLDKGDTVNLYQVLKWNATNGGWELNEGYADLIDSSSENYSANVKKLVDNDTTFNGFEKADIEKIAKLAKAGGAKAETKVTDGDSYTYAIDADAKVGMYLALVEPKDVNTMYNPIIVSADFVENGNEIDASSAVMGNSTAAKKSSVPVKKESAEITANAGDAVKFTITTTIPVYSASYTNPKFIVKDQLSDGLEMLVDTGDHPFTVTAGNVTYTGTPSTGAKNFTLTFDSDKIAALATPQEVTITYWATLTSEAPYSVNEETNDVEVEFSNNPQDDTDHGHKKDESKEYTFSIDGELFGNNSEEYTTTEVVKVGLDKDGNPIESTSVKTYDNKSEHAALAGAEFGLYKTEAGATNETASDLYTNSVFTTGKVKTDENGLLNIKGLKAGTYYLKELSAPAGYIRDTQVHTIEISVTTKTVKETETLSDGCVVEYDVEVLDTYSITIDGTESKYTMTLDGPHISEVIPGDSSSEIVNTKGVELPSTGGIGTTIFYIGGSILVLAAVILLVTKRRMSAED